MPTYPADTALIVVDLQPDFMPGGALPCHEGDAIVPGSAALLASGRYTTVIATQDWHPADHASFASQHPGRAPFEQITLHGQPQTLWPDHCVAGSPGAALAPGVNWDTTDLILRKGSHAQVDSYSAFFENHGPDGSRPATGLAGWLRERGIDTLVVVGYMTHNCDDSTARQAHHEGWKVELLHDASGSLPYRNAIGAATAEEIHRVFTVVMHTGFAAVASTDDWLAAVQRGEALQPDNVFLSNQRALTAA